MNALQFDLSDFAPVANENLFAKKGGASGPRGSETTGIRVSANGDVFIGGDIQAMLKEMGVPATNLYASAKQKQILIGGEKLVLPNQAPAAFTVNEEKGSVTGVAKNPIRNTAKLIGGYEGTAAEVKTSGVVLKDQKIGGVAVGTILVLTIEAVTAQPEKDEARKATVAARKANTDAVKAAAGSLNEGEADHEDGDFND